VIRRWLVPILAILAAGAIGWIAIARLSPEKPPIVDRSGTTAAGPAAPVAPPAPPVPADRPATVLFGGELRGRLVIPPCAVPGRGGLMNVMDLVPEVADGRAGLGLLLDLGDLASAPGKAGLAEAMACTDVLSSAGLGAMAVGETDLLLGLDTWRLFKNERSMGIVSICANLRDDEGRELAAGSAEFLLGRRRVVVTAILSPSFEAGLREAGVPIRLAPPAESVRAALARAGKGDIVVLLSHAPPEESAALLRELKEVDVAATAHAGDEASAEPEIIDGRPLFRPGAAWRTFVGASFPATASGERPPAISPVRRVIEPKLLEEGQLPPPQMPIDGALMELRVPGRLETAYGDALSRRTAPGGPAMAGPASCLSCHASAHASWQTGRHARSVASLRKTGNEATPHCLSCHATGLGARGGFPDGGPAQASVSCEACHGPGAAHAAAPEPAKVRLGDAKSSCAACHTAEVSPKFDPVEGWKKAGHAK
jgi:hypothetical protein